MRLVIFFMALLCATSLFAFNWKKCDQDTPATPLVGPFILSTSTAQFISSTGDCAMIGFAGYDKKVFLAHNLDQMQNDSARGGGEYLQAFAILSGCSPEAQHRLFQAFQLNYQQIYGTTSERSIEAIYESMEKVISEDRMLASSCETHS